MSDPRRRIPPVDQVLGAGPMRELVEVWGRTRVTRALRAVQERLRTALARGDADSPPDLEDARWYADAVAARLEAESRPSLRAVLNATGVVLHTNLGRAPLSAAAVRAVARAGGYATLEVDLESGERGSRNEHCVDLLRSLTGAADALVVNNNAAAVLLALQTLAQAREAVVSRGELVEIGGSFRVPEIIERSGAILREVGSTNRTHRRDYADALGPRTGVVLKVHRSNFRVEGFTAEVAAHELAELAGAAGVPLVNDLGSGLLLDLSPLGLPGEPTAGQALAAGADVVTMSGDKLLGGPQAGIILGRAELLYRMRANPLSRALRPDKLTLAALEATLAHYREPALAMRDVPVLGMLAIPAAELEARAGALVRALADHGVAAAPVPALSAVGGGAYPGVELPTTAVAVEPGPGGAARLARRLRLGEPPVLARIREGRLLLDPRTVAPAEEPALVAAVVAALSGATLEDEPAPEPIPPESRT